MLKQICTCVNDDYVVNRSFIDESILNIELPGAWSDLFTFACASGPKVHKIIVCKFSLVSGFMDPSRPPQSMEHHNAAMLSTIFNKTMRSPKPYDTLDVMPSLAMYRCGNSADQHSWCTLVWFKLEHDSKRTICIVKPHIMTCCCFSEWPTVWAACKYGQRQQKETT